ncbi:MAG: class II D-tagatose-bisphosphate aldolase, non-catalytic subunit [Synergistaceae bacterium]|nr:class II D-tagatose-bisphosphate aldolase, non-catalytic subunit [Synergistaceae bacterium]MBR0256237.1 class II D-tagatose-bisphosphate aldolase, non-catalytic subunit [Synergistaceae bacterium]
MKNPLLEISERRKSGIHAGIPSYCTANELVIEAVLEQGKRFDAPILIEGTANQINQFGGYTGMKPADFTEYVYGIADKVNFDRDKIILGGDHMGPLVWSGLKSDEAMSRARELVRLCVLAGFRKIHLDTSMKLADDPVNERLSDDVIAERGATLLEECENAYQELSRTKPDAIRPVYIIGSEVPIPGGTQEEEAGLQVTSPKDFETTLMTYKRKFEEHGISDRWQDVIAVVVQPGVEFGDKDIHQYDRAAAKELCATLGKYPGFVFEGHSTDYQPAKKLREMVADGIAILKVGPALTFSLREGLFALSMIERELVPENLRANFIETLEAVMLANPANWQKHYHGSDEDKRIARKYSYSDRCRYYFSLPEIKATIAKLFANIDSLPGGIPAGMLSQYMPRQYKRVRDGELSLKASALVKDCVVSLCEDYNYAASSKLYV